MAATYTIAGVAGNNPSYGWKLKSGTTWRSAVSTRATDIQIPGWHGSIPSQRDVIDATKILLVWHVTADASMPGQLMERVDLLRGLITRPQADLVITRQGADLVPGGVTQTALGRLRTLEETRVITPRALAEVRATVEIPGAFWRGPSVDFSHTATGSGWSSAITGLEGVNAPIGDAVILVTGPASGLRIHNGDAANYTTSESVLLDTTLAAGEQLRLDCATWQARRGTGIGWAGAGTDASAVVKPSVDVGPALAFTPRPGTAPAVTVTNAGTSTVAIRAKGAWL